MPDVIGQSIATILKDGASVRLRSYAIVELAFTLESSLTVEDMLTIESEVYKNDIECGSKLAERVKAIREVIV